MELSECNSCEVEYSKDNSGEGVSGRDKGVRIGYWFVELLESFLPSPMYEDFVGLKEVSATESPSGSCGGETIEGAEAECARKEDE
jgi:hypothetical protein